MKSRTPFRLRSGSTLPLRLAGSLLVILLATLAVSPPAMALDVLSGSGSSWAGNAIKQWVTDVKAQGQTVNYKDAGSTLGRKEFATEINDFAISEIPFKGDTADPGDTNFPRFEYSMLPVVAGGTAFMYNLNVGGKRLENLKLSQDTVAGIFSGQINRWNDPAIAATNPGVALPPQQITVVVRSDGSGATAQFTLWMLRQFPQRYAALCAVTGCNPKAATSVFPWQGLSNFTAASGSSSVTTYTANTPFTINYDEYSYALNAGFPVAQVKNAAGYYTVPTDSAVAVALTQAEINQDKNSLNYLSQDLSKVYAYGDPRTYPLSAYSYMIAPAALHGNFSAGKGQALGKFTSYSLCEGQRPMGSLGYSPLPMNLVLAAMDQVRRIPGIDAETVAKLDATANSALAKSGNPCNNPTFKPGDGPKVNQLVRTAPFPAGCDAACQSKWTGVAAAIGKGPGGDSAGAGAGAGGAGDASAGASAAAGAEGGAGAGAGAEAAAAEAAAAEAASAEAAAAEAAASEVCDPDTGVCTSTAGESTEDSGKGSPVAAVPLVLAGANGWGSPQTMLVVAGVLVFGLLLGPPIASRLVTSHRSRREGGSS